MKNFKEKVFVIVTSAEASSKDLSSNDLYNIGRYWFRNYISNHGALWHRTNRFMKADMFGTLSEAEQMLKILTREQPEMAAGSKIVMAFIEVSFFSVE